MDFDFKKPWTDSDSFYYNQAGMLLEKAEDLLELYVKHLVVQSSLAIDFPRSGYVWCVKKQMLMLFVAKLDIIRIKCFSS